MPGVIAVGDWIGNRFQVFDVHEGGMSLVYVVTDHLGGPGRKVVALKTLRGELMQSKIRVSRFAAECRLWAQLGEHKNIVRAYSVEVIDDRPYVVLELVQGGDLNRWIGTPRLNLVRALRFGFQFCVGLEHALRQGLHCHRDIKPGNLLVTEEGTLKITDFGLARVCEEMVAVRPELPDGSIPLAEPTVRHSIIWTDPRDWNSSAPGSWNQDGAVSARVESPSSRRAADLVSSTSPRPNRGSAALVGTGTPRPNRARGSQAAVPSTVTKETSEYFSPFETFDPRLTRTGARLGTGAYMAPEQFLDPKSVDVRADMYSFGVVLYEMITGELPFKGRSQEALQYQHTNHPPRSVIPSIPSRHAKFARPVDAIVQRCLKKEPSDRFSSVAELRATFKEILAKLPPK
jgi:serine/threonine protein kinase